MAGEVGVSVDRDLARVGSKSYAISKVNTVDVEKCYPHSRVAAILWAMIGALAFVGMIGGGAGTGAMVIVTGFFVLMTALAWRRSQIVEYRLILATSSGSVQAIKSRDADFIFDTRRRLEQAMAGKLG